MNKKELLDKKIKIMKEFLKNDGSIKNLRSAQEIIKAPAKSDNEKIAKK